MIFLGIDPGKSGAIAIIYENGDAEVAPYDEAALVDIIHKIKISEKPVRCCLERVNSMPKQGVVSTFTFGVNFGFIQGALTTGGIPFELVAPQKWKKEFGVTADKNLSIDVAKRLFPSVSLKRTERSYKDNDGIAEALLMAEYARRKMGGN